MIGLNISRPCLIQWIIASVFVLALAIGSEAVPQQAGIGYKPAADAEGRKTILLKDFHPEPALHAAAHEIRRAKFPVIDVHTHTNDAVGIGDRVDPKELVERMDRLNIRSIVVLTGMWGDKLQAIIDSMVKPYPGRFMVFTQFDWSRINDPDFSQLMVRQIDDSVSRGARGLKVLKELGLGVRDSTGKLITIDDPRLDPAWEECGRLGIPVFIHVADPEAFFHPIDAGNERYEELIEHPDWSFYGPQFPSLEELMAQRDRMFAKHPHTTFVALHFGSWPENLDFVEQTLQKFPNVMIETGAREGELGRQPRRTREIFVKYSDRIMFGTDEGAGEAMYQNYFRWLETADEYFPYAQYPQQGRWMIYGLNLPDDVLQKVYYRNAEKLLAQFKTSKQAARSVSVVAPATKAAR
ncbi:MAG: amidohydrolase family protein [Terriglobales bacterium]|jgi:predicted TIM-barrel fold metal-dependent hydrolase